MTDRDDQGDGIAAVILDMDGVVTDTAEAHFSAWKEVFDTLLEERGRGATVQPGPIISPMSTAFRAMRASGDFCPPGKSNLPDGGENDLGTDSIRGIGNLKNQRFHAWLDANEVPVFDDAKDFYGGIEERGPEGRCLLGEPQCASCAGKRRVSRMRSTRPSAARRRKTSVSRRSPHPISCSRPQGNSATARARP